MSGGSESVTPSVELQRKHPKWLLTPANNMCTFSNVRKERRLASPKGIVISEKRPGSLQQTAGQKVTQESRAKGTAALWGKGGHYATDL